MTSGVQGRRRLTHVFVVNFKVDSVGRAPEGKGTLVLQGKQQKAEALVHDCCCQAAMHDARIAADFTACMHHQLNLMSLGQVWGLACSPAETCGASYKLASVEGLVQHLFLVTPIVRPIE